MTSAHIHIDRYLNVGSQSLASDAPGWGLNESAESTPAGPTCWKCKGLGHRQVKVSKRTPSSSSKLQNPHEIPTENCSSDMQMEKALITNSLETHHQQQLCPVCHGLQNLPPKLIDVQSRNGNIPGMITSKRRASPEWEDFGPTAYAMQQMHSYISQKSLDSTNVHQPLDILYLATIHTSSDSQGISIPLQQDTSNSTLSKSPPPWLPIQPGEQLCNLVGNWRILQRVGSHRWTTDDLVTAFIAQDEFKKIHLQKQNSNADKNHHQPIHYLDLGCGNGSVLNMVLWSLLQSFDVIAFGIEARSEAVELARRSLSFNIGPPSVDEQGHYMTDPGHSCQATILHHDFRSLLHESSMVPDEQIKRVQNMKFHLITGTPPYFRVDFTSYRNPSSSSTSTETHSELPLPQAIINQGGMPTSIQSAPARCEFRGGIEAYCEVASTLLSDDGIFVVCENWLNVDRVYSSASKMGLEIQSVSPVKGKEGRKENLFGVFVMCKVGPSLSNAALLEGVKKDLDPIIVRNKDGTWTKAYCKILKAMSIPPNTTTEKNE